MTLLQLRAKANQKVFNSTTSSVSTDVIDGYINDAYQEILIEVLPIFGWTINGEIAETDIEAGQQEYALPNDLLKMIKVKVNDVELRDDQYSLFDGNIMLEDEDLYAESGTLEITYQDEFAALSATTDTPNLPTSFQTFLYKSAAKDMCEDAERWNKHSKLEAWCERKKQVIVDHYTQKTSQRLTMTFANESYE